MPAAAAKVLLLLRCCCLPAYYLFAKRACLPLFCAAVGNSPHHLPGFHPPPPPPFDPRMMGDNPGTVWGVDGSCSRSWLCFEQSLRLNGVSGGLSTQSQCTHVHMAPVLSTSGVAVSYCGRVLETIVMHVRFTRPLAVLCPNSKGASCSACACLRNYCLIAIVPKSHCLLPQGLALQPHVELTCTAPRARLLLLLLHWPTGKAWELR